MVLTSGGYSVGHGAWHISRIATGIFFILVVADVLIFRAGQNYTFIKSISYAIRLIVSCFSIFCVVFYLVRLRGVPLIAMPLVAFCGIIFVWFFLWLIARDSTVGWMTILFNPSYSIFVWLLVLWIPVSAAAGTSAQISAYVNGPFRWWFLVLFVLIGQLEAIYKANLYLPTLAVMIIYAAVACSIRNSGDLVFSVIAPIIVFVGMAEHGYRTYMLAALLVWPFRWFLPSLNVRRVFIAFCCIVVLPILYVELLGGYGDYFSSDSSNYFIDTRSFLFEEVWSDYSFKEFIVGRGLDGGYYSPYFYDLTKNQDIIEADYYVRSGSEVGWINILIKFGVIGLVAYLLQIAIVVFVGVRRTDSTDQHLGAMRFVLLMLVVFVIELPASITAPYVLWYVAMGHLISAEKRLY